VYTKTQSDTALDLIANAGDVYTKAAVDTALALTATTDNPVFTGYITTNYLKLLGVPTTSALVNTSKAYIFHPNRIQFAISSLDSPIVGQTVLTLDNDNVTISRDLYNTRKYTGQDAFFYGDITTSTNLYVQGNVDVYGTSNDATQTALDLKANADNADITGYITTNNLKLLGVPTTSMFVDNSKGLLVHPNSIRLAISSLATPLTTESVIVADNISVVLNRDVYCTKKLTGECFLFVRHYGVNQSQRSRKC